MSVTHPTEIEKNNLESHVELCALRYASLEHRLGIIEKQMMSIRQVVEKSHDSLIKALIGAAGSIVVGILSAVVILLTKTH